MRGLYPIISSVGRTSSGLAARRVARARLDAPASQH
jgi:hypothetical protein